MTRQQTAATMRSDPSDPRHGTANGYGNYGCRCERCTSAWNTGSGNMRRLAKERDLYRAYVEADEELMRLGETVGVPSAVWRRAQENMQSAVSAIEKMRSA